MAMTTASQSAETYNYDHFRGGQLREDARLTAKPAGPLPGDPAPDFELKDTEGRLWRLSDLRGQPVVLIFGSGTCPLTAGSLPGLKSLFRDYGHTCQWLLVYVREAHPGECLSAHRNEEQKAIQARWLKDAEHVPWPVLPDHLDGAVHADYGCQPNPVFLINAEGHVSFRGEMAHAPTLRKALEALRGQAWHGVVGRPGNDRMPHMLGATAHGWHAIQRGGQIAEQDVMRHAPPLALNLQSGEKMAPLLGPLADRSRPLPAAVKFGLGAAAVLGLATLAKRSIQR